MRLSPLLVDAVIEVLAAAAHGRSWHDSEEPISVKYVRSLGDSVAKLGCFEGWAWP
jgi:hypothetical protein